MKRRTIQRLFFAYTLPLLLPLLLFGTLSIRTSKQFIEEEVSISTEKTLGLIVQKIEGILLRMVVISNEFCLDMDVNKILINSSDMKSSAQVLQEREFMAELINRSAYQIDNNRYYLRLIGFHGEEFMSASLLSLPTPEPIENSWLLQTNERPWRISWIVDQQERLMSVDEGTNDWRSPMIVGVRVVQHILSGKFLGLLAVGTSERSIRESLKYSLREGEQLFVVDKDGNTLISMREGDSLFSEYQDKINSEYLVFRRSIAMTDWEIVLLTPRNLLLQRVNYWRVVMLFLLGFSVILSFTVSYFVAQKLTAPIRILAEDMQKVSSGELATRTKPVNNDEIGDLSLVFNAMLDQINDLMDSLREEHQLKNKYELQALFWQINPHFIYNTLASIRFMLGRRPVDEVDEALVALVRVLKHTMAHAGEFITVAEELKILKQYCKIQQIRTAGRVRFEIFFDHSIMGCQILKLTLQPLVENAVFHGLGPKGGEGVVTVTGFQLGEDLIIEIGDDGVGSENIPRQNSDPTRLFGSGIGINNINDRIVLHFGKDYGVHLRPNEPQGTVAVVRLPFLTSFIAEEKNP